MTSSTPDMQSLLAAARRYLEDPTSRSETRAAVDRLRATDSESIRGLVDRLRRRSDPVDRALAALLLPALPTREAATLLIELVDSESDPLVVGSAVDAVRGLKTALSPGQLARLADHDDPRVRRALATSLYGDDDAVALETLLKLVADRDRDTRDWAAWALADTFPSSEVRDRSLRHWLANANESQLRAQITGALESPARTGDRPTAEPTRKRRRRPETKRELLTVLMASANPLNTDRLALDTEAREIRAAVRATPLRDNIRFETAWALRPLDLLTELNEYRPHVLHFSGHGTPDGRLVFVDDDGEPEPVGGSAFAAVLATAGADVRVVVLNACFSADLAHRLTDHVDVAVGMDRPVGDEAARVFASAFYSALGFGNSVALAFGQGKAALELRGIPEERTPQLVTRVGVDPSEVFLVDSRVVAEIDPEADREQLRTVTSDHLGHLERHATLPIADSGFRINRSVGPALRARAEVGSLLVLGEPGTGKTGAVHGLASELIAQGHDVVVLAADLLGAAGQRGLREELELQLPLYDALAAWRGSEPAFLIVDALDAARGKESAGALLELIERVASAKGRWRVVASVRSFDLRHNPDLQAAIPATLDHEETEFVDGEFAHVRHLSIGPLSETELAAVTTTSQLVGSFVAEATPRLRELLLVPFNLSLLVTLLERGQVDRDQLHAVASQLDLLDLYWDRRVVVPPTGRDARELIASRLCEHAVERMRLQVPRADLRVDAAVTSGLEQLLSEGVVVEVRSTRNRDVDRVGFSHHVLFDYAVHRLLLSGEPDDIASRLASLEELILLARPSLVMTFAGAWSSDTTRTTFWDLALRLSDGELPAPARLVGPAVAVDLIGGVGDLQPILAALDQGDSRAPFVLRHVVGARAATGLPSRPLAGSRLGVWAEVATALAERVQTDTAYAVRILVWGLSAEYEHLAEGEIHALGRAARAFLRASWAQDRALDADIGAALEAVARTYCADAVESRRLLSRIVEVERLPAHGAAELRRIADEVPYIAQCDPEFAADLYVAAFSYDESSEEKTALGASQIIPLTTTRRQDWEMSRYALVQRYSDLLAAEPNAALRALSAAAMHEAREPLDRDLDEIVHFTVNGRDAAAIKDRSGIWDAPAHHHDVDSMLSAFEDSLRTAAEGNNDDRVQRFLEALSGDPKPAAIWRRALRAAAAAPATLAPSFVELAKNPDLLLSLDLREPLGELLRTGAPVWSDENRAEVEGSILSLPTLFNEDRVEAATTERDRLIGCIPAELLVTPEARRVRDELETAGGPPPNLPPFSFTTRSGAIDPDEEYRGRGIDPAAAVNRRVISAIEPVSEFARAHANVAPTEAAVHEALPAVRALVEILQGARDEASTALVDDAEAWLSEAAAALAWQSPIPLGDDSIALARDLAVRGARGVRPSGMHEDLNQFDRGGPSWGVPAGRIDAARALLLLAREPSLADDELLDLVEELAVDPDPAVRWMVARSLGMARQGQPERVWRLIHRIANDEPSAQVRLALLHPLGGAASSEPENAIEVVEGMYREESAGRRHEALMRGLVAFLVGLWIWQGQPAGRRLVDEWIEDIETCADVARPIFFSLREPVTRGDETLEQLAIRERALGVWADLTKAAGDLFLRRVPAITGGELTGDALDRFQEVAHLLDVSATELFFASGAYAEQQRNDKERLRPEVRERFYREAEPVFDVLVEVGAPAIVHHVLETLSTYIEFDARGVLLRIGKLLEAGQPWGYQLESLAETAFVQLVERYLASYRDLFLRDAESRRVLVRAIEGFVDAGWPSARRLLYGLDDMFR